jgi:hypothetical protein
LGRLSETEGRSGVAQRAAKGSYQRAEAAAPGAGFGDGAPAEATFSDRVATPAEKKELAQQFSSNAGKAAQGNAFYFGADKGDAVVVDTIRNVGQKTFFLRNGQWIDSSLTKEEEAKPQQIERFSKEYFKLATELGKDGAAYLGIEEPVIVKLNGQVYQY